MNSLDDETVSKKEWKGPSMIAMVFLSKDLVVKFYKHMANALNESEQLRNLVKDGDKAIVISRYRDGFTRQLLIGPLSAGTFEYSMDNWKAATQNYKHLPDIIINTEPNLIIVAGREYQRFLGVAIAAYNHSTPLTKEECSVLTHLGKKNQLYLGSAYLFHRNKLSIDNPIEAFEEIFSLKAVINSNKGQHQEVKEEASSEKKEAKSSFVSLTAL